MPLIIFFQGLGIFNPYSRWEAILEIGLILAIIVILAEVTESKRKLLQKFLTETWNFLEQRAKAQ
jgi:hypothetical protein